MDRGAWKELITGYFRKYRWASIIILTGLFLMSLPNRETETYIPVPDETVQEYTLQTELEELLSKLDGAGKVKVLLTQAIGSETYYQTNIDRNQAGESLDERLETVLINGSDRSESGLIRRIDPPAYLGAVVLCQGAEQPRIKLAVVDAVSTATGLTSDKISVLKLK